MSNDDLREDTWLSNAQLAKCARADAAGTFPSPIPTQLVSNGEYMPIAQTEDQKRVEFRTKELADSAAKKLGVSRRAFLAGAGGMAATFLAMNEVYGAFFNVDRDEMFEHDKEDNRLPRDLFIFDDQLHMIRQSHTEENRALRALAQGYPGAAAIRIRSIHRSGAASPPSCPMSSRCAAIWMSREVCGETGTRH